MSDTHFQTQYNRLNKAQKQAVEAIDGPVMVIAGPGTGKTSILTLRIANIIKKTDTKPENILALTFTESGAYAMRKKLVEIIGTAAYKVEISTFHGFCNDIIKQYPERFPRIIGSTAITEVDQIAIMEKIILISSLDMLRPYGDPFFYVRPVLGEIRKLKREAISVEDFKKGIKKQEKDFEDEPEKVHVKGAHKGKMKGEFVKLREQIEKNKELLGLYEAYEQALVDGKFYDFEDMIVEVVKTLKKDQDLLLILQETYQYILADEHQDANNAQNAILELLSNFHDNPNLFIVGDEKQAIFRFQGASLDNFLYFKNLYPKALLIHLEENYRSTQSILDASHSLITNNESKIKHVKLSAKVEKGKLPIQIHEFVSADAEHAFVAKEIQKKIKAGAALTDIAVLYRNNKDSSEMASALLKLNIPYRVESDDDILKNGEIRKLLLIFEAINDLTNEELLAKVLFIDFLGHNPLDVYKALASARNDKKKLYEVVGEKFPDISKKLNSWASLAHNKPFIDVFEVIVRESGFLTHALQSQSALEELATLESFFEKVRELAGARKEYYIKDFVEHLTRVREHGILTKPGGILKDGVRLMTAHKSKGLEFDYAYIIGAYDGHWGNKSQRTYFHVPLTKAASSASIDDERRLFYVSLTRARKEVVITYPSQDAVGKELLPSQFIDEIEGSLKSFSAHKERISVEHKFSAPAVSKKEGIKDKAYLQSLFLEQGMNVSALNNYLRCPWEYFFVNLIRIPKAQNKHQMYGTAVHTTLKTFFDKYRVEEDMSKEEFLNLFEHNLNKMPLPPHDLAETLKKGRQSLGSYFDAYKKTWPHNFLTEYSVKGVHIDTPIGTLLLKGNLDKIEFINDRDVNVIDYKTGKPKSKVDENYHRQLVFYRLLLDLDDRKKYVMKSGELDFVEPDDKGKFKKVKYEVKDEEVRELTDLLKKTAGEIYNLEFFGTTCGEKDCEYCELGKLMK